MIWVILKSGIFSISSIFFIFSFLLDSINLLFISLIILFLFCVIFALEQFQKRIIYLLFLITFFLFLLGNYIYLFNSQTEWWLPFSINTTKNTILLLMLSLLSITIGYSISEFIEKNSHKNDKTNIIFNTKFNISLKKISKLVFLVTIIPTFFLIYEKVVFSQVYGYVELYLSYEGNSLILEKLKQLNIISFFMFLATMPSKKESKFIIILFLLLSIFTLFAGARTTAVTSFLIVLFYLIYRNNILSGEEKWLTKKIMLLLAFLSPVVIVILSFWGNYRVDLSMDNMSLAELFFSFFKNQGGSVNIISYVQEVTFPNSNSNYTFGPIINFLKHNIITNIFFDFPNYSPHSVDAALFGNNMSYTITYLIMPHNYIAGLGMGSSYIAELLVDFGYIGVFVFNILLGFILYKFNNGQVKKPWIFAIQLLMLQSFLNLPRNVALIWFLDGINLTTIGSIIMLYFVARLNLRKNVILIE